MCLKNDEIIYVITRKGLQFEAKRIIGRPLSDLEIIYTTDFIEWGLSDIHAIFVAAIEQAVKLAK